MLRLCAFQWLYCYIESLSEFLIEAKEKIPGDAVAFGKYTPQLYALMDWKSGIYIAEWENMGIS